MDAVSPRAARTVKAPCPQGPRSNVLFALSRKDIVLLEGLTGTAKRVAFIGLDRGLAIPKFPKLREFGTELRPSGERLPPELQAANSGSSAQSSIRGHLP